MKEKGCSISEAVKRSGVEAYVLRYWEEEGLLKVPRNAKGHRVYTEAEFAAIGSIQKLKKEGLSLKDIRKAQTHSKEESQEKTPQRENTQQEDEKKQQFYRILERVVKEVAVSRSREARYRRLDEAIRRQQEVRKMTAAAEEKKTQDRKKQPEEKVSQTFSRDTW